MAAPPLRRVTARVLPVSPDGTVLLLEERDPARPERHYWSSIGGAVDGSESLRDAAVREMFEETGLVVAPEDLVGPASTVENAYTWNGVHYLGVHTYFALPLSTAVEVRFDHLEAEEVGNVLGSGWWSVEAIDELEHEPPMLSEIMRAAVAAMEESR
jgi:8-oxo-dGTP pyrophosphatase MutT (NUDIX family)